MHAKSIFLTTAIMVLANGVILAAVMRNMPAVIRSAATYWCIGVLLSALGAMLFGLGAPLPRPLMLVSANAAIAFGMTTFHLAVRRFFDMPLKPVHLLPAALATLSVLVFSTVMPSFQIRVVVVSIAWAWIMAMCVKDMRGRAETDGSLAVASLTILFVLLGLYAIGRCAFLLALGVSNNFAVEDGSNWVNLVTPLLMALLPVIGTTSFLLMCGNRLQRGLERAAATDYLTGLPNRRGFDEAGKSAFLAAKEKAQPFALAVFDVDRFKLINDTYGHAAGDRALIHVATSLQSSLRPSDIIARTGGEEFVVFLFGLTPSQAGDMADHMRLTVEESKFCVDGTPLPVTVSVGVAFHHPADTDYDDVMLRADRALYIAKAKGRNRLEASVPEAVGGLGQA